jgi:hypothetical protein
MLLEQKRAEQALLIESLPPEYKEAVRAPRADIRRALLSPSITNKQLDCLAKRSNFKWDIVLATSE